MKKLLFRAAMATGTLGVIVAGAAAFSAFEAHVVNVTATIAEATTVTTDPLQYGTVFPQEVLLKDVSIGLSQDFLASDATGLSYVLKQKPKCGLPDGKGGYSDYEQVTEDANGVFSCPDTDYVMLPLLCPYLSKTSSFNEDKSISSFHGPIDLASWTDAISTQYQAEGTLNKDHNSTTWTIDLHAPCFKGQCAQDWASYVKEANPGADPNAYMADPENRNKQMGCDLWFEVNGVTRPTPTPAE